MLTVKCCLYCSENRFSSVNYGVFSTKLRSLEKRILIWKTLSSTSENKPSLAEFAEDISRMVAEKHYHWIVNEAENDSEMESDLELTEEGSTMEVVTNISDMNQVCMFMSGATLNGVVDAT